MLKHFSYLHFRIIRPHLGIKKFLHSSKSQSPSKYFISRQKFERKLRLFVFEQRYSNIFFFLIFIESAYLDLHDTSLFSIQPLTRKKTMNLVNIYILFVFRERYQGFRRNE